MDMPRQLCAVLSHRRMIRSLLVRESDLGMHTALAVSFKAGVYKGLDYPYRYKVLVRISGFGEIDKTY